MESKKLRIVDIARLAGVSTGTVDRVLHNRGNVSKAIEARIRAIIEQLGYEPNIIASTLGSNKKYKLAALIPSFEKDPYWEGPYNGICEGEQEFAPFELSVDSYFFHLESSDSFLQQSERVLQAKPDAILMAPVLLRESLSFFQKCKAAGIPFALFNTDVPSEDALCYIGQDSFQSGLLAGRLMSYSINQGGRVALIHIDEDLDNSPHLVKKEEGFFQFFGQKAYQHFKPERYIIQSGTGSGLEAQLTDIIDKKEALCGIFVTTSRAYRIASALESLSPKPSVVLIGYDLLHKNLQYLEKGLIQFLINQNSHGQGYWGIVHLAEFLLYKRVPDKRKYLPLDIITLENARYYPAL
ncbi:MAG: substrate-binding domain-containing protein [Cyclobacteriaceae bacterium]|nr:substrate-binding domain-containing protein [Cyclobacteriaceae bacterium]